MHFDMKHFGRRYMDQIIDLERKVQNECYDENDIRRLLTPHNAASAVLLHGDLLCGFCLYSYRAEKQAGHRRRNVGIDVNRLTTQTIDQVGIDNFVRIVYVMTAWMCKKLIDGDYRKLTIEVPDQHIETIGCVLGELGLVARPAWDGSSVFVFLSDWELNRIPVIDNAEIVI